MQKNLLLISLLPTVLAIAACGSADTEPIEVTFDGDGCTVAGPSEILAGDHKIALVDKTAQHAELWLLNLEEGKTIQDLLDMQSEPGEWYPRPAWASYDRRTTIDTSGSEGGRIVTITWELDKVGEHPIACYVPLPQRIWFVGPLRVVGGPSE